MLQINGNNETIVQELAFSAMWDYFKVVKESWASGFCQFLWLCVKRGCCHTEFVQLKEEERSN